MLLFIFLVSTSFPVGAAITHELDPTALTFLRFCIASTAFGILLAFKREWHWPGPLLCFRYLCLGALLVVFFVTMFEGLRLGSAVSLGAVFTLIPMMTAVIAYFLVGQKTSRRLWGGLLIAAAGAVWVVFGGSVEALLEFSLGRGELIFWVGCLSYAAYSPCVRRFHQGENLLVLTFWTLIAGTVILAGYGWQEIIDTPWAKLPFSVYGAITYLAVCNTAISFFLLKYASFKLPAAKVMAYTFLTPAIVLAIEGIVSRQIPDMSLVLGVLVTAMAMIFLQRTVSD